MSSFIKGQPLFADQLNEAFDQTFPAGSVSSYSATLLAGATQSAWFAALGLPAAIPGAANGLALLDGTTKIPIGNLPASIVGSLNYQGTWNANTNNPALASGVGTKGFYYKVSVGGATFIDGNASWSIGDFIAYNGTIWDKIQSSGNVTIPSTNITDSTASGRALLTAASVAAQRVSINLDQAIFVVDLNQTITSAMTWVVWSSITAPRVATLPAASSFNTGQAIYICDESGNCSATKTITINRAGSDTINGGTNFVLNTAFSAAVLIRASASKWTLFDLSGAPPTPPTGRLTLTTGTPVLTTSVSGATSIIYTPYIGASAPVWGGMSFTMNPFTEISQLLTSATLSPAAAVANSLYDMFLWTGANGATMLSRGPPWASGTSRGAGAGTTQLIQVQGLLVNAVDITNGPAAGFGTYVGTIATNASATIDYIFGSAASGGGAASFRVWNYFNRARTATFVIDNGTPYTYTSATIRAARGSTTNRITFVCGFAEDSLSVTYNQRIDTAANIGAFTWVGIGLDSTSTAYNGALSIIYNPTTNLSIGSAQITASISPQIGLHFLQAIEQGDGVNANTLDSPNNALLQVSFKN